MGCANNHTLDAGHAASPTHWRSCSGKISGPSAPASNAAEAWRAASIERGGLKIGFLAYASVYQAGYEARDTVPGLAALRIHSHYYIADWDAYGRVEPGAPPAVCTIPYPEDIERLRVDRRSAGRA